MSLIALHWLCVRNIFQCLKPVPGMDQGPICYQRDVSPSGDGLFFEPILVTNKLKRFPKYVVFRIAFTPELYQTTKTSFIHWPDKIDLLDIDHQVKVKSVASHSTLDVVVRAESKKWTNHERRMEVEEFKYWRQGPLLAVLSIGFVQPKRSSLKRCFWLSRWLTALSIFSRLSTSLSMSPAHMSMCFLTSWTPSTSRQRSEWCLLVRQPSACGTIYKRIGAQDQAGLGTCVTPFEIQIQP